MTITFDEMDTDMRRLRLLPIAVFMILATTGCGVLRGLTTKYFSFNYPIPSPPAIDSPVGTPEGSPLVVSSSANITDDLVTKFDKFHGGVDWAGMRYTASLTRGESVNLQLLTSLTAPTGSGTNVTIPADAALIEEVALTSSNNTITKNETASNQNEPLRSFIESALSKTSGSIRVYIYFRVTSPTGGRLVISNVGLQGKAHGSLF